MFEPTNIFAGQNLPTKNSTASGAALLDRMTLALVDRLPNESEREFARSHGTRGAFELANQLISSREFFDRQSLYWQSQLSQTPAWLWENKGGQNELFPSADTGALSNKKIIWYTQPPGNPSLQSCTGVWTLLDENQEPQSCSCDEQVDALPVWDSSASMRVCPTVKADENCGSGLQKCVPADARINPKNPYLAVDTQSAGGRAITRMLTDVRLAQGRALATAVVTGKKWSEFSTAMAYSVQSRSSIELLTQWAKLEEFTRLREIHKALNLGAQARPLKDILSQNQQMGPRRLGTRPIGESPAEELLMIPDVLPRTILKPLRATQLNDRVWQWNNNLLLNCQVPHLAQQHFTLPLPHPSIAREGSYFCSSCHISLDRILQGGKDKISSPSLAQIPLTSDTTPQSLRQCAIDHALQYLFGERLTGAQAATYRRIGVSSYQLNSESISAVIRDLSLELARRESQ